VVVLLQSNPSKRTLLAFILSLANAVKERTSFGLQLLGCPTESCLASKAAQSFSALEAKFKFYCCGQEAPILGMGEKGK